MQICTVCGREYSPKTEGAVIDGLPHCGGCQRDAEEVAEDAAANPYTEEVMAE